MTLKYKWLLLWQSQKDVKLMFPESASVLGLVKTAPCSCRIQGINAPSIFFRLGGVGLTENGRVFWDGRKESILEVLGYSIRQLPPGPDIFTARLRVLGSPIKLKALHLWSATALMQTSRLRCKLSLPTHWLSHCSDIDSAHSWNKWSRKSQLFTETMNKQFHVQLWDQKIECRIVARISVQKRKDLCREESILKVVEGVL